MAQTIPTITNLIGQPHDFLPAGSRWVYFENTLFFMVSVIHASSVLILMRPDVAFFAVIGVAYSLRPN